MRTLFQTVEWSRRSSFPRPLSEPGHRVYSPRLRRDQVKALFYLKELEGRPMTKLAQEAVDRSLDERGGAGALIARGRAVLGDDGRPRGGGAGRADQSRVGASAAGEAAAAGASGVVAAPPAAALTFPRKCPALARPKMVRN